MQSIENIKMEQTPITSQTIENQTDPHYELHFFVLLCHRPTLKNFKGCTQNWLCVHLCEIMRIYQNNKKPFDNQALEKKINKK